MMGDENTTDERCCNNCKNRFNDGYCPLVNDCVSGQDTPYEHGCTDMAGECGFSRRINKSD